MFWFLMMLIWDGFHLTLATYSGWTEWSPCNRRCQGGFRYRYNPCNSAECYNELLLVDVGFCYKDCKTENEFERADCMSADAETRILCNGGYACDASFPRVFIGPTVCQSTSVYFTVTATKVPYTLKKFLFKGDIRSFKLFYKISDESDTWFKYPTSEGYPMVLEMFRDPWYTHWFYVFPKPLEVYAFAIVPYQTVNYYSSYCLQISPVGCHLPIPANIEFVPSSFAFDIELPFVPFIQQVDCNVEFKPMYFQQLKIINTFKNEIVPSDETKSIYAFVTTKNLNEPYGKSVLSLFFKIDSLEDIANNFHCIQMQGNTICQGHFSCIGETFTVEGEEYGNWESGELNVIYKHDSDECLGTPNCHHHASCINTIGSYYCKCSKGYFGDGTTCYEENYWIEQKLGVFPTERFKQLLPSDIYCRVLFYANKTDALYVCSQHSIESAYGCLASFDMGVTWKTTHPYMDNIFGQDMNTGIIYGYASNKYAYIMYNPILRQWFCISDVHFSRIALLPSYTSSRIVVPQCTSNLNINDTLIPLYQSQYLVKDKLFAGEYAGWTSWLPCTRRCGSGYRYRYNPCTTKDCYDELFQVEDKACWNDCETEETSRSDCVDSADRHLLYNGGYTPDADFPEFVEGDETCLTTALDNNFTFHATPQIPYTLSEFKFLGNDLEAIDLEYTVEYGSQQWFRYPTADGPQIELAPFDNPYAPVHNFYKFDKEFEAYDLKILPRRIKDNANSYCTSIAAIGCHLPIACSIAFNKRYVVVEVGSPFIPLTNQWECATEYQPLYANKLQVMNIFADEIVSKDVSQNIHTVVNKVNMGDVYGINSINLIIKVPTFEELLEMFYCIETDGNGICHALFTCIGEISMVSGEEFGNWEAGSINTMYRYDIDECLQNPPCHEHATCINTVGSYHCKCKQGYFGDGTTCYEQGHWLENKLGVFSTDSFPDLPATDIYCRVLFYANKTDALYVCSQYDDEKPYGCLVTKDVGQTWQPTHPYMDNIFGQDLNTGIIYGYASNKYAYIMYNPVSKQWFSISDTHFNRIAASTSFNSARIVNPTWTSSLELDEYENPMHQSRLVVRDTEIALITDGVVYKSYYGWWYSLLNWDKLPLRAQMQAI